METFGIIGMTFGIMGFTFGLNAMNRIGALERRLKDSGILDRATGTD